MSDSRGDGLRHEDVLSSGDRLRRALMRLTSPQVEELQSELARLKIQLDELRKLEGDTSDLQSRVERINSSLVEIEKGSKHLLAELRDPSMIGQRLDATIVPALHRQVDDHTDDVAETLAPVIGPAMRRQIRDAKDDIIDALYPVIGQIISKAISEALRELTRNIDARLRQQLNFRDRTSRFFARLRGVSEAELLLRGSLPYTIERVFLIHRETGLLLSHISRDSDARLEAGTISGMLTAIQDFVRDSFSGGEGDLEEITHGARRILLEAGQRAYVAVVVTGVEPEGYSHLIRDVVRNINLQYEKDLKQFDGNMKKLPDFRLALEALLDPTPLLANQSGLSNPLPASQKRIMGFTLLGFLTLIAVLIFSCIFVVRLWPIAFPAAALPSSTPSMAPSSTPTHLPTTTPSMTSTLAPTLVPTMTSTLPPPAAPTPLPEGVLTGNLNVRSDPSIESPVLGVILAGEKVIIRDQEGVWYFVTWPLEGNPILEGWINGETFLDLP